MIRRGNEPTSDLVSVESRSKDQSSRQKSLPAAKGVGEVAMVDRFLGLWIRNGQTACVMENVMPKGKTPSIAVFGKWKSNGISSDRCREDTAFNGSGTSDIDLHIVAYVRITTIHGRKLPVDSCIITSFWYNGSIID